jgi:hypothetical protein
MTDFAVSSCHVCLPGADPVSQEQGGTSSSVFDRERAMQHSLAMSGMPVAAEGSAALARARQLIAPATTMTGSHPAFAQPEAERSIISADGRRVPHANPATRNVFFAAVQEHRDRVAAQLLPPEQATGPGAGEGMIAKSAGADSLTALNAATRDIFRDDLERHSVALPVRDAFRDALLAAADEIENPSPIALMRQRQALGPESRLDIERVERQMIDQLREASALFERMGERSETDTPETGTA